MPSDSDNLLLFRRQFNELRGHKLLFDESYLIRGGFKSEGKDKIVQGNFTGYDNDVVKSYLITFRQFTLEREPVSFYKICNITFKWRTEKNREEIKLCVSNSRECWGKIWKESGPLGIKLGDLEITKRVFYDILINGWMAHSDKKLSDLYYDMPDYLRKTLLQNYKTH